MAQEKYIEKVQNRTGSIYHIRDPRIQDLPNNSEMYLDGTGNWSVPENTDTDTRDTVGTSVNQGRGTSTLRPYGLVGVNAMYIDNEDGYGKSCVLNGLYFCEYAASDANENRHIYDSEDDGAHFTNRITFSRAGHVLTLHAPVRDEEHPDAGVRIDGLRLPEKIGNYKNYHRVIIATNSQMNSMINAGDIIEGDIWLDITGN